MRAETRADGSEFETFAALTDFISAFEAGSLPRRRWNHAARLTVAMWYFSLMPAPEASARIITRIRAYCRAQGIRATATNGYHETIILFWLRTTLRFLDRCPATNTLDRVNAFVAAYRQRRELIHEFYSPEALGTWRARGSWVEPDRKPLQP